MVRSIRRSIVLAAAVAFAPVVNAQIPLAEFAARRDALLNNVGDGVTLVLGAGAPPADYVPYQQSRPFYYLTGFREPDAALVMVRSGAERRSWIFVPPKNPAQEVWTGIRLGAAGAQEALGIEGRSFTELRSVIDSLLRTTRQLNVAGDLEGQADVVTPHGQLVARLRAAYPEVRVSDVTAAIGTLRGVKSPAEFDRLRIAASISARGHIAAMRMVVPGVGEFELEAAAEYQWRREGADGPGYTSIVGSGPNSTVLHYGENSRAAQAGEVIVMDMAASFDGYTADITRTIPVGGRLTDAQREIYAVVLDALKSAERQIAAGAPARLLTDSSNAVLSAGLVRLGLMDSMGGTYDCGNAERPRTCSQLGLFYMHSIGHGIGLDVHDPEVYYETGRIAVGSAFTLEPGIYVRPGTAQLLRDTPRNRALLERLKPARRPRCRANSPRSRRSYRCRGRSAIRMWCSGSCGTAQGAEARPRRIPARIRCALGDALGSGSMRRSVRDSTSTIAVSVTG
jgi:Xaa-Pro aminopeptidase